MSHRTGKRHQHYVPGAGQAQQMALWRVPNTIVLPAEFDPHPVIVADWSGYLRRDRKLYADRIPPFWMAPTLTDSFGHLAPHLLHLARATSR
jgi:hypothetical protein